MLNPTAEDQPVPTITIPDDTYELLSHKAAAVGLSPGEFIALTLSGEVPTPTPVPQAAPDAAARRKARHELMTLLHTLSAEFLPDHETDVSREAMYREREESQL